MKLAASAQHKDLHHDELVYRYKLGARCQCERAFWLSTLPPSELRACPLRRSTVTLPLPMDSPHNLPNSRSLSAHGLHMLLYPDRRHHHFPDLLLR